MQAFELCMPLIFVRPGPAKRRSFHYAPPIFIGNKMENSISPGKRDPSIMHPLTGEATSLQLCRCKLIWRGVRGLITWRPTIPFILNGVPSRGVVLAGVAVWAVDHEARRDPRRLALLLALWWTTGAEKAADTWKSRYYLLFRDYSLFRNIRKIEESNSFSWKVSSDVYRPGGWRQRDCGLSIVEKLEKCRQWYFLIWEWGSIYHCGWKKSVGISTLRNLRESGWKEG